MKKFNLMAVAATMAFTAAMTSCGGTKFDDPDANYNDKLLDFVPAKSEIVMTANPQAMLKSAGGDWTDSGIELGKIIKSTFTYSTDDAEVGKKIEGYLDVEGLNHSSMVVFCDGLHQWYAVIPVTDADKLAEYFKAHNFDEGQYDGFKVWSRSSLSGSLVIDTDDELLWLVKGETDGDAVKAVKSLKEDAKDKTQPEWARKRLCEDGSLLAAVLNFDATGINLNGALKTIGCDPNLLGEAVSYIGFNFNEKDHKASVAITTLDESGNPVNLLNPDLRKGADFSALNALPSECLAGVGLAVNTQALLNCFPKFENQIGDTDLTEIIKSVNSLALGCNAFDYKAATLHGIAPGMALVVKLDADNARKLFDLVSTQFAGMGGTIGENEAQAVFTAEQTGLGCDLVVKAVVNGDMLMLTNISGATFGNSNPMSVDTSDALMLSFQKAGVMTDAPVEAGTGYGLLTTKGIYSETTVPDKYPGLLGMLMEAINSMTAPVAPHFEF